MNYRASAVELLLKYDRAFQERRAVGWEPKDDPAVKVKRALNVCDLRSQRLASARHCTPRLTRAICAQVAEIALRLPTDDPAQEVYDEFLLDLNVLMDRERRGRERPDERESRIVLVPRTFGDRARVRAWERERARKAAEKEQAQGNETGSGEG